MGCTAAIVFTCFGASYGTAKAGVGIVASGVLRPDLIVRSMLTRFFLHRAVLLAFPGDLVKIQLDRTVLEGCDY